MRRNGVVRAKLPEFSVIELPGVVRDDNPGDSESADNKFPYAISGISLCNFGERLPFYPYGKVINGDDQEFSLQGSLG